MKKTIVFLLIFFVAFFSLAAQEGISEQIILIIADGMTLLHDVIYKVTLENGIVIKGTSNFKGKIILNTPNIGSIFIELDLEPIFYTEEYHLDLFLAYEENEKLLLNYEVIYLSHPNDEIIIEIHDGYEYTTIVHDYYCRNDLTFSLTLDSSKNYILIYQSGPFYGISD